MGTRKGSPTEPVDPVAVERCLGGQLPAYQITTNERLEVVRTLARRGWNDKQIAMRTRWGDRRAVTRFRRYHHIPAGRPDYGRRARAPWWQDPTQREQQVRQMAGLGLSDIAIAARADVKPATVGAYRRSKGIPAALPPHGPRPSRRPR